MKAKSIEVSSVDEEYATPNDHWNTFAFKVHCSATEAGLSDASTQILEWIYKAIHAFQLNYNAPQKAINDWLKELNESGLSFDQRRFITTWVSYYIDASEFDVDLSKHNKLLKSYIKRQQLLLTPAEPLAVSIRKRLKEALESEINELPKRLQELDSDKRLNVLCKLLPFILPKVETVEVDYGEPSA